MCLAFVKDLGGGFVPCPARGSFLPLPCIPFIMQLKWMVVVVALRKGGMGSFARFPPIPLLHQRQSLVAVFGDCILALSSVN